ncbi:MAG: branched-chain amino acid ABC transporter permease [candidate division NC10 bacterium]|nr:branched-chain amino acid ABC transporter permease [candidate division NC10 bacterium]
MWRSGAWHWLVAVAVLFTLSLLLGDFYRHLGMTVLIMALFALSYNLLLGETGLVSFGHAAFFGVGGYTYALLATKVGTPALVNIVLAPIATALIALLVGYFCVRLHGILFSMLTLAFGQVIYTVTFQWYSFTGGDNGIVGLPAPPLLIPPGNYAVFVIFVVVTCGIALWRLAHSPFGQALRIMRENRERAEFIGIPVRRLRLIVFTIAGGFAGIAGLLFALLNRQVFPDDMYWAQTAQVLVMSLLGGIFTFLGPVVGAFIVTVLQYWIATYTIYWLLILGTILLLCVLFFPQGIVGSLQERLKHRLAPPPSPSPLKGEGTGGGGLVVG